MSSRSWEAARVLVSCEYFEELLALDEIDVLMSLSYLRQHRIGLDFDIVKLQSGRRVRAARGFQEIGCMRKLNQGLSPIAPPSDLAEALKRYAVESRETFRAGVS